MDQVCCHRSPGEVVDWPATPAETPNEDSQKTQTHTKTATQPQTLTVLSVPGGVRPFQAGVASQVIARAVLLLPDDTGLDRSECFLSHKFNKNQLNYSIIKNETPVLISALQHFNVYVSSVPVVVFTDYNPLIFLNSLQCPKQSLVHWALFLQSHGFDIHHIKGQDNPVTYALSRSP